MRTFEMGRRLAELGQKEQACKAYAIATGEECTPAELLEAAIYILENGGDYKVSFTVFVNLYNAGYFQEEILRRMAAAFYEPNIRQIRNRYERNCRLLSKYQYCFRKDFIPFEELPVVFFPFDDHDGYVPLDVENRRFLDYTSISDTVITRNFFSDLSKPVLASDVYSQYELEYLADNVRRSEDVAYENHVYLHYTDWARFCAWLQVLNMKPVTQQKKTVFLIGDEIAQYPIDFKERFGIDYESMTLKPIGVRDITKMIWHTQLSTHNGGDFFNEIFDYHPNLLCLPSIMFYNVEDIIRSIRKKLTSAGSLAEAQEIFCRWENPRIIAELYAMSSPSDKDLLVGYYLCLKEWTGNLDPSARIAPAVFFQPHFHQINYVLRVNEYGAAALENDELDKIHASPIFRGFKYIKTFTPLRRVTTSYAATLRFMYNQILEQDRGKVFEDGKKRVIEDAIATRVLNRSYLRDIEDRLYRDAAVVRFEDGKLNPEATFTRLAAFLDIPYTESMTYCSEMGRKDPGSQLGADIYAAGFDLTSVYKTYDDYINDSERKYIEFSFRDAYEFYGYDFQYYDGQPVDLEKITEWIDSFDTLDEYIKKSYISAYGDQKTVLERGDGGEGIEIPVKLSDVVIDSNLKTMRENRIKNAEVMLRGLSFVNKRGQPLRMTPMIEPDPALLKQEIYH